MENNNFVQNQPTPPVQPPVQNAPQQQPYAPQPQQPYGQPGYPQQPYAPQQPRESIVDKLYGKADTLLGKLLTWVSVVLYVLVPVAVLMGLILGVVSAAGGVFGGFSGSTFFSSLVGGVQRAAGYAFMATLLAYAKNRLDK